MPRNTREISDVVSSAEPNWAMIKAALPFSRMSPVAVTKDRAISFQEVLSLSFSAR